MGFELSTKENKKKIIQSFAESFESDEHKGRNSDVLLNRKDLGLFGVFDGMGSHKGSEEAAHIAAREIVAYFEDAKKNKHNAEANTLEEIQEELVAALIKARDAIRNKNDELRKKHEIRSGEGNGQTRHMLGELTSENIELSRPLAELIAHGSPDDARFAVIALAGWLDPELPQEELVVLLVVESDEGHKGTDEKDADDGAADDGDVVHGEFLLSREVDFLF